MRLGRAVFGAGLAALVLAAGPGAWAVAGWAERATLARAEAALDAAGAAGWARVTADGTVLALSGHAPDAAAARRLEAALAAAAPTGRVASALTVAEARRAGPESGAAAPSPPPEPAPPPAPPPEAPAAPFVMASDGATLTLAGPAAPSLVRAVADALEDLPDPPELRDGTLPLPESGPDDESGAALARTAARALARLGEAKAEFRRGLVRVTAVTPDAEARDALERALREAAPPGTVVLLDAAPPPPVLSPFRFVVTLGPEGPALLGCDMPSAEARRRVAEALAAIGGERLAAACRIGLGEPLADWAGVAAEGVAALAAAGGGRFELVDEEARLVGAPDGDRGRVEAAGKALAAALPRGVTLRVIAPGRARPRPAGEGGPDDWFAAEAGPAGGPVRLLGAVPDAESGRAAAAYARARFGGRAVTAEFAPAEAAPPPAWRRAALAALDALAVLEEGRARFDGDALRLEGRTETPEAVRAAGAALAGLAAAGATVETALTVDVPALAARLPLAPEACLARLTEQAEAAPILFAPGSTEVDAASGGTLDALAATLARCPGTVVEIEGHTDAQGRESTNLALSQSRAEAVLEALFARGVSYAAMRAKGYGESRPVADNATEAGRALNRRIAFSEVGPAAPAAEDRP